jgi:alpha-1,3-mannosyltransferase
LYGCVTGRIDRCIGTTKTAVITADEAIARIHSRILERRGGIVMFTNHHLVNNAVRHPEITTLFNDAIALPDGIALDVASRILYGTMFPENLNGTDFFPKLLNALPPTRIFLIGSAAGVAEQAQLRLAELFPTHSFVGSHHGYPTAEQSLTIVEEINSLNAEIVVVGMGNPHQELWMSRYGKHLNAVGVCGGALLDRYAGLVQRGPAWLSRWRLEWLYRIIQEPRRMSRRYITGGVAFMSLVLRQKIAGYRV